MARLNCVPGAAVPETVAEGQFAILSPGKVGSKGFGCGFEFPIRKKISAA
jgi:hypothetical protein